MENLQIYFDESTGPFRYTDEGEDDSGVEDLPFSFYSPEYFGSTDTQTQPNTSACNDADDNDLTYIDDVRDGDYRPNKSAYVSKKGKRSYKRRQYNGNTCLSQLVTPEKLHHRIFTIGNVGGEENRVRHYARKDRTPNTILKMMERHRESERVRHHTLNESMKDVCLRVPGYDPDVKETKVIQMQRIIAYECFLENTLTTICNKMGVYPKSLKIGTHFITEAMEKNPIEEFYQPSNYKTSDLEDEAAGSSLTLKNNNRSPEFKVNRRAPYEKHHHRYRREKISSPTIDSTTNDFIKVMPLSPVPQMPGYKYFNSGCYQTQCFIPIDNSHSQHLQSSQESGIKIEDETPSTTCDEDNHFGVSDDIGCFMDQNICVEPDQLKTVTPSFMKEEINTSFTSYNDNDQYQNFDLSSPIRHHGKVFLQSPKTSSAWSKQGRSYLLGKVDTPMGKEMQSVSPENVLKTKPKIDNKEVNLPTNNTSRQFVPTGYSKSSICQVLTGNQMFQEAENAGEIQYVYDQQGRQYRTIKIQHIYIPKFDNSILKSVSAEDTGKNKRKRYTPLKTLGGTKDVESEEEEYERLSDICGETTDTDTEDHDLEMEHHHHHHQQQQQQQQQHQPPLQATPQPVPLGNYTYGFPQNWGFPAPAPCRGQGKKVKYAKPLVDHRKSTWMNGFMMFSKINRSKFTSENPGVHTSQIQKLMGEAWRKLSAEEKQPYKDQAKEWCERMKSAGENAKKDQTNCIVKPEQTDKTKTNCATSKTESLQVMPADQKAEISLTNNVTHVCGKSSDRLTDKTMNLTVLPNTGPLE